MVVGGRSVFGMDDEAGVGHERAEAIGIATISTNVASMVSWQEDVGQGFVEAVKQVFRPGVELKCRAAGGAEGAGDFGEVGGYGHDGSFFLEAFGFLGGVVIPD